LLDCLGRDDTAIKSAALLALLRLGVVEALSLGQRMAGTEIWPALGLGLAGGRSVTQVLKEMARSRGATPDCLLALGLVGDLSAVGVWYDCLADAALAPSAAQALELITGAGLYESAFAPDDVAEDELFEEELIAWKEQGKAPTHPDGRLLGVTVMQLTQSQEQWRGWLSAHSKDSDSNRRYRSGKPSSPAVVLENLLDNRAPHRLRQLAAEELAIRYGCDVPFEADMPVARQLRALREIEHWIASNGGRFQSGLWYFAGQPC